MQQLKPRKQKENVPVLKLNKTIITNYQLEVDDNHPNNAEIKAKFDQLTDLLKKREELSNELKSLIADKKFSSTIDKYCRNYLMDEFIEGLDEDDY